MNVVIPTFKRDFGLLNRQLDSFDKFLRGNHEISIVLNDDPTLLPQLLDICNSHPALNIRVMDHHLMPVGFSDWGWANQQIIKLIFAHYCTTPHYLILDSKNFLIDECDIDLLVEDGKASTVKVTIPQEGDMYFGNSYKLFGLDWNDSPDRITWGITPYIMNKQFVLDMLQYIQDCDLVLSKIIGHAPGNTHECSEFALYSAWLEKNKLHNEFIIFKEGFNKFGANKNRLDDHDYDPQALQYYR